MKSRETKANDLTALTASLQNSKSAMVVSFKGLSVAKDQEFRNSVREAGAKYEVVKNTLARIAVKGTDFEQASEHFKGVTAIAWTENDPVILSKAISKFMKDNAEIYTFKTGVVDGNLVDLTQLTTIANLPSKEELISKLLFVLNSQAQRIVTVINAVPRDLAIVVKQIGEKAAADAQTDQAPAAAVEEPPSAEAPAKEVPAANENAPKQEAPPAEVVPADDKPEASADAAEELQEKKEVEQDAGSAETEQQAEATDAAPVTEPEVEDKTE
ncbi:MAG: 50S ribosomal protein L10 [Pyrinomonadaceae bacterium]